MSSDPSPQPPRTVIFSSILCEGPFTIFSVIRSCLNFPIGDAPGCSMKGCRGAHQKFGGVFFSLSSFYVQELGGGLVYLLLQADPTRLVD